MSYVVIARWVTLDEHRTEVEAILREFAPLCLIEPGCQRFVAHQSIERPNEFLLYEQYREEQDFD